MNEWFDSLKKPNGNFRQSLQERIEKTNPRRELTAEASTRLLRRSTTRVKAFVRMR